MLPIGLGNSNYNSTSANDNVEESFVPNLIKLFDSLKIKFSLKTVSD